MRTTLIGPGEDEAVLERRAAAMNQLSTQLETGLEGFSVEVQQRLSAEDCTDALDTVADAYSVRPDNTPVFIGPGLPPWQGAVTWILDVDQPRARVAVIQLRRRMLVGYDRRELLAHEYVHAARVAFDEPVFEEFFAYRLSSRAYRRFLGPIVSRSWEAGLFLGVLASAVAASWFTAWALVAPLALLGMAVGRLSIRHWILARCVKKVGSWAVMIRLKDQEIFRFAGLSHADIRAYAETQTSPRWQDIRAHFLGCDIP